MADLEYGAWLKRKFGNKVLRVALDAGLSCPNRDGSRESPGCMFCDTKAFSPAVVDPTGPVTRLREEIQRNYKRFDKRGEKRPLFLAYLQPYSNTYASASELRPLYEELLSVEGVVGLCIGTRPDCLKSDVWDLLEELAQKYYISLELGLQTSHDLTLERINRGHDFSCFEIAVDESKKRGVEIVAHVILGLPGESLEDVERTAKHLARLGVEAVKLHQLMVIEGTLLARLWRREEIDVLSFEEYGVWARSFARLLNGNQVIQRLMAEAKVSKGLLAPIWSSEKKQRHESLKKMILVGSKRN